MPVGEREREIQVNLDMEKLRSLSISPIQIQGILRSANLDFPTGSLRSQTNNTAIRLTGKLSSVDEIRNLIVVTLPTGTQIRLSDVAEVVETAKDLNKIARVDGKDAVLLNIFKQGDANAIDLSNSVAKATKELQETFKNQNLQIGFVSDTSEFTKASIKSVIEDLLMAVLFSIPFSILGAILALALSGISLNIYAMLGLVMLIGLVAKNAILLVDFAKEQLLQGETIDNSLITAVKLRIRPILMTTLSTVIGMIPVAIASGSGAELRNGLGWVIIGGMTLSTLLTLIVVPVVFKIFHRTKQ